MNKKTVYENKLDYNNSYNRRNYQSFAVRFNVESEEDIITYLQTKESIKAYLKDLITADMKKKKKAKTSKVTKTKAKTKKK